MHVKFHQCGISPSGSGYELFSLSSYKSYFEPLKKFQNKAMQVMDNIKRSTNADSLFSKGKILKLD